MFYILDVPVTATEAALDYVAELTLTTAAAAPTTRRAGSFAFSRITAFVTGSLEPGYAHEILQSGHLFPCVSRSGTTPPYTLRMCPSIVGIVSSWRGIGVDTTRRRGLGGHPFQTSHVFHFERVCNVCGEFSGHDGGLLGGGEFYHLDHDIRQILSGVGGLTSRNRG